LGVHWRRASPEQQERLTREFRTLLVRTYSGALANYRDHIIEFRPLRARPGEAEVTVRSQVKRAGAEPIAIDYDLEKGASGWKVFDVRVGGISLVATYRTTFAEEIRNHGIEGLIDLLAGKNRQGGARTVSARTPT
jgi:phospholipid transport system substrate-binding protein